MRIVAGDQYTPYVISSRPTSLAKLTVGTIMLSGSELGLRITESTTLADVFKYIEEHADEVDAKVAVAHPVGKRSVKNGFLVCYESNRSPAFRIITKPSSSRVTRIGVTGYRQGNVFVEPTLYVFARAPGEGKNKWYIPPPSTFPQPARPKPNTATPPPRPTGLPMYAVGTVLKSEACGASGFQEQFVRVTKHVGDSKMFARRLQTVVNRQTISKCGYNGNVKKHTYRVPTNVLVPGGKPIELVPSSIGERWASKYGKKWVWWYPEWYPIHTTRVVHTKHQVVAGKRILRALWKRVQKKQQENALAPGGSTARAAIARATRTSLR